MLVLLRFIQGLAIGGQWGGAMLLVTESAPADKRGWFGAYAHARVRPLVSSWLIWRFLGSAEA